MLQENDDIPLDTRPPPYSPEALQEGIAVALLGHQRIGSKVYPDFGRRRRDENGLRKQSKRIDQAIAFCPCHFPSIEQHGDSGVLPGRDVPGFDRKLRPFQRGAYMLCKGGVARWVLDNVRKCW